jgi:hypothetical protein
VHRTSTMPWVQQSIAKHNVACLFDPLPTQHHPCPFRSRCYIPLVLAPFDRAGPSVHSAVW